MLYLVAEASHKLCILRLMRVDPLDVLRRMPPRSTSLNKRRSRWFVFVSSTVLTARLAESKMLMARSRAAGTVLPGRSLWGCCEHQGRADPFAVFRINLDGLHRSAQGVLANSRLGSDGRPLSSSKTPLQPETLRPRSSRTDEQRTAFLREQGKNRSAPLSLKHPRL